MASVAMETHPPLIYEHSDIPVGVTCAQYRRALAPVRTLHFSRLRRWIAAR
jgi:hypothetical protein